MRILYFETNLVSLEGLEDQISLLRLDSRAVQKLIDNFLDPSNLVVYGKMYLVYGISCTIE
jgi:hypothetical protein